MNWNKELYKYFKLLSTPNMSNPSFKVRYLMVTSIWTTWEDKELTMSNHLRRWIQINFLKLLLTWCCDMIGGLCHLILDRGRNVWNVNIMSLSLCPVQQSETQKAWCWWTSAVGQLIDFRHRLAKEFVRVLQYISIDNEYWQGGAIVSFFNHSK